MQNLSGGAAMSKETTSCDLAAAQELRIAPAAIRVSPLREISQ
jgi:hypothetical protein